MVCPPTHLTPILRKVHRLEVGKAGHRDGLLLCLLRQGLCSPSCPGCHDCPAVFVFCEVHSPACFEKGRLETLPLGSSPPCPALVSEDQFFPRTAMHLPEVLEAITSLTFPDT